MILLEKKYAHIAIIEELIRSKKQKRFSRSSEKYPDQAELFHEVEALLDEHEA